jgi:MoxR-like ATPase
MEEQQVSVDGAAVPLPRPHLVIATQNPHSQLGTFPLVESQLDRFAVATTIGYPDVINETRLAMQRGGRYALADMKPICDPTAWHEAQLATETVHVSEAVAGYAVELCRASRVAPGVLLGASPRAAIWLIRAAQAEAVLSSRYFATPDDVKAVAVGCLAHRLITDESHESIGRAARVVARLLETTPTPRP